MTEATGTASDFREQGRNAYPHGVNPYVWREDACACGNWDDGFAQAKWAAEHSTHQSGDRVAL
jgi:hypothetical protein